MTPAIFQNIEFFLLLPFALGLIILGAKLGGWSFKLAIIVTSVFFIAALPGIKGAYVLFMTAFMAVIWMVGKIIVHDILQSVGSKARQATIATVVIVFVFSFIKYPTFKSLVLFPFGLDISLTSLVPILGFSFFGLKAYSFFADISAGRIKAINSLSFLAYFLYFPTFLSGPITRYPQFSQTLEKAAETEFSWMVLGEQAPRFVLGLFKTFVLAGLLSVHAIPFLTARQLTDPMTVYVGLVAYYWYEYMNFSGYSDLAITTSKILNIDIPENFNKPFLATSLTDLWRRWHMSLAHWLRDYIYYPLLFKLMNTLKPKRQFIQASLSSLSIFITFVLCGLWHGQAFGMILFGVLSGIVLGVEILLTQLAWPKVKGIVEKDGWVSLGYAGLSRIFTFHIAILTFGPVLMDDENILIAYNTLFGV